MDAKSYIRFSELIVKLTDGDITHDEFTELNNYIANNTEAAVYYNKFMVSYVELLTSGEVIISAQESCSEILKDSFWQSLAKDELTAPAVKVEKPTEEKPILVKKAHVERMPRKVNKFYLITAITQIAALIFILIYVRINPREVYEDVAVISDSIDTVWGDGSKVEETGSILFDDNQMRRLAEGYVKLKYYSGSEVILEGPVDFSIPSADCLEVYRGKAYSFVPDIATGFKIITPTSEITDLGTKFGVNVTESGQNKIYVFKGKVNLIAGLKGQPRKSQIINEEEAIGVSYDGAEIGPISFNQKEFVRHISSKGNFIWSGDYIDMVDLLNGGGGFGSRAPTCTINVTTGKVNRGKDIVSVYEYRGGYSKVLENPFVDGVFVPDIDNGPVSVSSQGHIFSECPDTNGENWLDIITDTTIRLNYRDGAASGIKEIEPAILKGKTYAQPGSTPGMVMHSNSGITFDLDAVRAKVPGMKITAFKALCGLSESNFHDKYDIYILVDGKVRAHLLSNRQTDSSRQIHLILNDQDRFLTFITTDGGDGTDGDWCVIGSPILDIQIAQD